MAAFAFTGCTWGGEHTFDLKIEVPTDKMFGPQSKAPLPNYNSDVTVIAYLAGDYAHHVREIFENVPAGTRSLPITLGGVPLGRSTLVIEAKADYSPSPTASYVLETGYYGEREIVVTGGVNNYRVDMDYGVIVKCNDSYSQKVTGETGDGIDAVSIPNIGARPLAEGEFLILQRGKRPLEQKNFTSRLRNNLTTAENYLFDGYMVGGDEYPLPVWLYSNHYSENNKYCKAPAGYDDYQYYSPTWTLYSGWKI